MVVAFLLMESKVELIATIETPESLVHVYANGIIHSRINEGVVLDTPYLITGKKSLLQLGLDKKFYVLAESNGFFRTTRKARQLSASREYSDHIAAVAIVTNHQFVALVADMYFLIDKPATPTKLFVNRDEARSWLEERMVEDGKEKS